MSWIGGAKRSTRGACIASGSGGAKDREYRCGAASFRLKSKGESESAIGESGLPALLVGVHLLRK
jgi:hypothetical protein